MHTMVDLRTVEQVRNFLDSEDCRFVENMNRAGLSFNAMTLVIQGIENICNEVEQQLKGKENESI